MILMTLDTRQQRIMIPKRGNKQNEDQNYCNLLLWGGFQIAEHGKPRTNPLDALNWVEEMENFERLELFRLSFIQERVAQMEGSIVHFGKYWSACACKETIKTEKMLTITSQWERQIKTTMQYHYTPNKMLKIIKVGHAKYWQECGITGTLIHSWWKFKWQNHFDNKNIHVPYYLGIPFLGFYPWGMKVYAQYKGLYVNVHNSFIDNGQ